MTTELVSMEHGELHRSIFSDPEIYELEMTMIFGRAWLFVAHESQLPNPGDFFEAPMGKDNVLIVRQRDGSVRGLLNTCTHRGNAVCRADEGNTKNFMCTYHGWTFGLDGELIGVPGFENLYHSELDKDQLGLRQVAQIDIYKGCIFATMDPSAPPLLDFLGATGRLSIDLLMEQGDMEVIPGIQKYTIDCNWKFPTDNIFDFYHAVTHLSAFSSGVLPIGSAEEIAPPNRMDQGGAAKPDGVMLDLEAGRLSHDSISVLGEYGHAIGGPHTNVALGGPQDWRDRPGVPEVLGPVGMRVGGFSCLFPHVWRNHLQLCVRVPRSPSKTELWFFSFVDKNAPEEVRRMVVHAANHIFGPAGLLEQEDGENWSQSTRQTNGYMSKEIPHALKLDLGRGKIIKEDGLSYIEGQTSEHPQLWTYGAWSKWLTGMDWASLKQATTPGDYL